MNGYYRQPDAMIGAIHNVRVMYSMGSMSRLYPVGLFFVIEVLKQFDSQIESPFVSRDSLFYTAKRPLKDVK